MDFNELQVCQRKTNFKKLINSFEDYLRPRLHFDQSFEKIE